MLLHPEFFEFPRQARELELPPFRGIGVSGVRELIRNFNLHDQIIKFLLNLTVPNQDHSLSVRVYQPSGATSKMPVVVMNHGGGWVATNIDAYGGDPNQIVVARDSADGTFGTVVSQKCPDQAGLVNLGTDSLLSCNCWNAI